MPVQFPYPETSWAQGRIRKRGDRNNNNNDDDETRFGARVQLASDVRRGRPQLEEPGLAEAERLAGASFRGRGGPAARSEVTKGAGGLSPDVIQEHKSQIQGFGQQWQLGAINWRKFNREIQSRGWDVVMEGVKKGDKKSLADAVMEIMAQRDPTSIIETTLKPAYEASKKYGDKPAAEVIMEKWREWQEKKKMKVQDPTGKVHEIDIGGGEE